MSEGRTTSVGVNRRVFLRHTGMGLAALLSGYFSGCFFLKKRSPNFVIIFTDDQGYGDVGCYGAKGYETPNLDRMAAEGLRFTSFYVSEAVCSASRASLLTGCYAQRVSIHGALSARSHMGLHPEEETIAELLKKRGYVTGIFGKWHLGKDEEFLPLQQGFDEYFGLPYSNDMWPYDYLGRKKDPVKAFYYPPLRFIENNSPGEELNSLEDMAYLTRRYTEKAIQFIQKHQNRPFFLYVAHSMPHTPINASEAFKGKSQQGLYGDVIMEIDWSVGQILKTLEELHLDEKTLIVFTSDNGPWRNFGNHAGSPGPLREGKGTAWEGGVRVPCIMRWPGEIPAGQVTDEMASTIDLLPTLCSLAGAPLPKKKIDGYDLSDFILAKTERSPRREFYYYYEGQLRAVRKEKWKLVFPHRYRSYEGVEPGHDGVPGPYAFRTCGLELYDLETDIGEQHDVSAEHPEIVKELQQLAEKVRERLGDALTGVVGKEVRPAGKQYSGRKQDVKNLATGKRVTLKNPPSPRYNKGGAPSLVDGQLGSNDFHDDRWLGFEEDDLEGLIDLGEVMQVNEVVCSFLEEQAAWIFAPKRITIEVSNDGEHYELVRKITPNLSPNPMPIVHEYIAPVEKRIRFIKIVAQNVAHCPSWHPGSGGKAWIFADEFIVR